MTRALVVAAVVALAGCKKSPPPEPVVIDAGAPAPKLLTGPSTLSLLEPAGEACEWRQLDPVSGDRVVLASFPGTCFGGRIAFSPDLSKAVVWFDPLMVAAPEEKVTARAYVLPVKQPRPEVIPLPSMERHLLSELAVDDTGAVLAFLEEEIPEADQQQKKTTSGGKTFDLSEIKEGLPVLVHAYRLEGKAWRRSETRVSTTGWDYAMGVKELAAYQQLGPRSVELAAAHAQGDVPEGPEAEALAPLAPPDTEGQFIFLGAGGVRFYVWEVTGEFAYTTGLVVANGKPLPGLGFAPGELAAIRTSGPHVLVTAADSGARPRLYALPAGKLVFSSDGARATTFWPGTAKPESHER